MPVTYSTNYSIITPDLTIDRSAIYYIIIASMSQITRQPNTVYRILYENTEQL